LLQLIAEADCYVKLSGAYRIAEYPWSGVAPLARALIERAPHRMVWGSDWPHVAITDQRRMPTTGDLLDLLVDWTPDKAIQRQILVENPLKLYGSPSRR
jgi:predicted TIM-barrel fold metal-dependent hydrolase